MYQRMMDDISKQIKAGEVSGVQFKERILDKYDIACELVAFSNSHGGKLVVGIKDKTGEANATFMNNDKAQEFVITVWREESNQVEVESNEVGNQVEEESNQVGNEVHDKSNQVEDHDTRLRHSDTDSDTGLRHSNTDSDTRLKHSDTRLRHPNTNLDLNLDTLTLKKCHCLISKGIYSISVQFLEPPQKSWNALVYPIKPRTVNVTSPPLLQQDICR